MDSAQIVLGLVKIYLRTRKIKNAEIATLLGYRSAQTVTNLLNGDKYFSSIQATALCKKFPNLNYEYLTKGEGSIIQKMALPECNNVTGSYKDKFLSYVFETFQKTAFASQNRDVMLIFLELNALASKLDVVEKQGILSDEEINVAFKLSDTMIKIYIDQLSFHEETKVLTNDHNAR